MKKQTIIAAKWRIAAICFFLLWALSGFAQQASITNLATDYTAKKISFTVKWTAAPHDNKIWVITDYVKIEGATTVGPWSRALVTNVSASTGTATIYSNGRGFLLTTSGVNGSANITATLISSMPARFSWCAFALNYPPRAVLNASGWYDLKGTKPFVVNETPLGNDVNTYTGGCITSLTDATNNPHAIIPGPPTITAVNSPTICYNTAANLTATVAGDITAAMTYTWNIGGTITTTTVPAKTTGNLTTNTTYTVTAKNAAGCTSAVSNTGTITVLEAFSPGEIAATGETICYADTPGMIDNITAASGGDGHITYQWRYATSRPFSGATASSYAPDAATIQLYSDTGNTFTITRWAKDGTCNTTPMQSTGTWILTVHGALNSGMIVSTGQTICSGDTPDVIGNQISATGSDGNITYQWRHNGETIPGATATSYTPAASYSQTAGTHTFTRWAKDDGCNTTPVQSTGEWVLTVNTGLDPGSITTSGETVCYGNTPTKSISNTPATGGGNITYEWRHNGVAIPGATLASYTPAASYSQTAGAHTFTRWAKDDGCNTTPVQSTGQWILTVSRNFSSGDIEATGETICYGATPGVIDNSTPATGEGNITYEWRHNGVPIPGATASSYTPAASYSQTAGTHTFTRWAKDNGCNTTPVQSTGQWILTVYDEFSPGAIETAGQAICYNSTPGVIGNTTEATGGDGNITYEWRHNGVAIPGATLASYTPAASYSQTAGAHTFTRWAKDDGCNTTPVQSTGQWILTTSSSLSPGSITSGTGTTVAGANPAVTITNSSVASGGSGTISYQWRSTATGVTTATHTVNSSSYAIGTYSASSSNASIVYTIRRYVKAATCGTAWVASAGSYRLTVLPLPPGAGTLTHTITCGTMTQIWSEPVRMPACTYVTGTTGVMPMSNGSTNQHCINSSNGYSYYNWHYVNANKSAMCPSPWRVPTAVRQPDLSYTGDFPNLFACLGETPSNYYPESSAWGGSLGGYVNQSTNIANVSSGAYYWSQSTPDNRGAFFSFTQTGIFTISNTNSITGYQVRCVRIL